MMFYQFTPTFNAESWDQGRAVGGGTIPFKYYGPDF